MNYIELLKQDLEKGYSKSDLEKLIGLPRNNLSGVLKGDRGLSKKSKLKIERWAKIDKPDPLMLGDELNAIKSISDSLIKEHDTSIFDQVFKEENSMGVQDRLNISTRIEELKKEMANPPEVIKIGRKAWLSIRKNEIIRLEAELNSQ